MSEEQKPTPETPGIYAGEVSATREVVHDDGYNPFQSAPLVPQEGALECAEEVWKVLRYERARGIAEAGEIIGKYAAHVLSTTHESLKRAEAVTANCVTINAELEERLDKVLSELTTLRAEAGETK